MKVQPTNQTIEIEDTTIIIDGVVVGTYDKVNAEVKNGEQYIECFLGGELEDRYWVK